MKSIGISAICALIILSGCQKQDCTDTKTSKEQLSQQLEGAVLWYQQAAEMRLSYYQAYAYAKVILDKNLASLNADQKPAVVLDIDETVLDNSPYEGYLIENGETYGSKTWKEWTSMAKAEVLPGVKDFISYAQSKGVEVYYISNRTVDMLNSTIDNLKTEGLPNADSTHVLLKEETSDKTIRRNKVRETHQIIVFVGDNLTDYHELYADRDAGMGKDLVDQNLAELLNNFVMLPNPMYGEWEAAIYKNDFNQADSTKLKLRRQSLKSY